MGSRLVFNCVCSVVLVLVLCGSVPAMEKLDRGLVAVERDDGSVFLSWRWLAGDSDNVRFKIQRLVPEASVLTSDCRVTNFVDEAPGKGEKGTNIVYELHCSKNAGQDWTLVDKAALRLAGESRPFVSIPLKGEYDFQKIGIADLDGDGAYEYVIKQPNFNTDPYQQPGYWKKSTTTYKIEAYETDGTMLWQYDMGWSIEAGIWYSPWVVYDVDGDGRAEVYCKAGEGDPRDEKGLVQTGPEYLVKLNGQTGKIVAKTDWLNRDGYPDYNYYCRNFLTVAYLDGKNPSLIMQRGTYNLIKIKALDKDLNQIWYWESPQEQKKYGGQGSHGLISADVDEDGKDELVIGAAVIDDNGKGLWTLEMGHPDVCYVADINPDNPGLEIFYGFETRQQTDGICVVDAKTGRKLWTHKEPTRHIHGQGMLGDVIAEYPGMEVYAGERDFEERWLYSAKGQLIAVVKKESLNPRPVWWDADPQKEVVMGGGIRDWGKDTMQPVEGQVIAVVDCLGDHHEEVITCLKGELRIYTTTTPTQEQRPCLMQDQQYRLGVAAQTMGYYYPAQLGLKRN